MHDGELVQLQQRLETLLLKEGIELVSSNPAREAVATPRVRVDWSRYHLQLLFVDRTDRVRSRITSGIFERIAEWNGFGRALYTWHAGIDVAPPPVTASITTSLEPFEDTDSSNSSAWGIAHWLGASTRAATAPVQASSADAARTAAILSAAESLKLSLRDVVRPAEQFELDDLDSYDLVVCLDPSVHDAVMAMLAQLGPGHQEFYKDKVCQLTSFCQYEVDSIVLARGGLALLPMQLSFLLHTGRADLSELKQLSGIHSPSLSGEHAMDEWNTMVQEIIWCTAGLVKYLLDAMPADEPEAFEC